MMICKRKQSAGFTLLEALITLLILAIGVLGVAVLQFKALRFNHDAYLRTQISILAEDIIDQIRLNDANASAYLANYVVPASVVPTALGACDLAVAANAVNDLACWRAQLINTLPPGTQANITKVGALYTVNFVWTDREEQVHTINYTFQP